MFLMALAIMGCTRSYRAAVAVEGPQSNEEKLRIAQATATEERLVRLRGQLKERFPALSHTQLAGLGLSWNQTTFQSLTGLGSGTTVSVVVTLTFDGDLNPVPIVDAARAIIEAEIRANTVPLRSPAGASFREEGSLREPLSPRPRRRRMS